MSTPPVPGPAGHLSEVSALSMRSLLQGHDSTMEGLGAPAPWLWLRRAVGAPREVEHLGLGGRYDVSMWTNPPPTLPCSTEGQSGFPTVLQALSLQLRDPLPELSWQAPVRQTHRGSGQHTLTYFTLLLF